MAHLSEVELKVSLPGEASSDFVLDMVKKILQPEWDFALANLECVVAQTYGGGRSIIATEARIAVWPKTT